VILLCHGSRNLTVVCCCLGVMLFAVSGWGTGGISENFCHGSRNLTVVCCCLGVMFAVSGWRTGGISENFCVTCLRQHLISVRFVSALFDGWCPVYSRSRTSFFCMPLALDFLVSEH
jgi:hypothetical protein